MKILDLFRADRFWLLSLVAVALAVTVSVWGWVGLRLIAPPPLVWDTVASPVVRRDGLTLAARVIRRDDGCTGGPQIDVEDNRGALKRLPAPTREIDGQTTTYHSALASPLAPGRYRVRVLEIVTCQGVRHERPSPWVAFSVAAVS